MWLLFRLVFCTFVFFFKQKTAYEMRISDWSSDVCSSDLRGDQALVARFVAMATDLDQRAAGGAELRVYWLEHANAETLLPTLQQLVGGGSDPAQKAGLPPATSSSAAGHAAPTPTPTPAATDRQSVVEGQRVSAGLAHGGRRTPQ